MRQRHVDTSMSAQDASVAISDVLVLGSGAAGYQAAWAAARAGAAVTLVGMARGASPFILGFNTCLHNGYPGDSTEQFNTDTFSGGYELAEPSLVRALTEQAPLAFEELLALGVPFERAGGGPALRHLSGSRYPRSVYVKKGTGSAILKAVSGETRRLGVAEHLGSRILTLLVLDRRVVGALAVDQRSGRMTAYLAGNTVLAMGGIGGIYGDSTYPVDVEGSSYSLALDAGASLRDMEFVQFEPTVVATPADVKGMEMPTAMLGDGAVLRNRLGDRFMCGYNPGACEKQIEKARLALFIQKEIDEGRGTEHDSVHFDATPLSEACLKGYVTHYQRLSKAGIDAHRSYVEVHPAAHSLMGGVWIDHRCQSEVEGLLVCGEAAGGLHGASRIAGNGAADAITFGRLAGRSACQNGLAVSKAQKSAIQAELRRLAGSRPQRGDKGAAEAYRTSVAQIMSSQLGIRRHGEGMMEAVRRLKAIHDEIRGQWDGSPLCPLARARSGCVVALAIAVSAVRRQESRGAHYRTDFPERDDSRWKRSTRIRLSGNGDITAS